jgi:formyltetrahydrofolate hydrolase
MQVPLMESVAGQVDVQRLVKLSRATAALYNISLDEGPILRMRMSRGESDRKERCMHYVYYMV